LLRELETSIASLRFHVRMSAVRSRYKFLSLLLVLIVIPLRADDGAASIAEGGIVVMKREPRITMAKEVLQISVHKVIVDYDFRNDSDQDITTDVAFPIPDYENDLGRTGQESGFSDFQVWIDGVRAHYRIEARAFVKDKDYTQMLAGMHVDIASFGHEDFRDLTGLSDAQIGQLVAAGLIDKDDHIPQWRVRKKYYWQQTFPAHKTTHVRHEYTPVVGSENSVSYGLGSKPDPQAAEEIKSFCLDGRLHETLEQIAQQKDKGKDKTASYNYVDFILTTANTWKTPIEDFMLIVERARWKNRKGESDLADYVSFCWDGPVSKIDADHFSAHVANLVPARELRIGFFSVTPRRF
jgi:hypothetical protein